MDQVKKGKKHTCTACMTKFYDFDKDIAICPKCGTKQVSHNIVPEKKVENKIKTTNEESNHEENILEEEVSFADIEENIENEISEDL